MRPTDFQRGSIFGLVLVVVAFAFALSVTPNSKPANQQAGPKAAAHTEQQSKGYIARWWRWTVSGDSSGFYTFGLIFVGIAQAGFFIWQLVLIREGLSDTQEAADAAKEQAKLARESLIASNRAWVKVDEIEIESDLIWQEASGHEPVHATVRLSVKVSNIGGTPATAINTHMEAIVEDRDVPGKLDALIKQQASFPIEWTRMLLPGQSYRRPWGFEIAAAVEAEWRTQSIIIGRTAYRIAQDAEVRVTTFAFQLVECEVGSPVKFVDLIRPGGDLQRDRIGWSNVGGEYAT